MEIEEFVTYILQASFYAGNMRKSDQITDFRGATSLLLYVQQAHWNGAGEGSNPSSVYLKSRS